MRNNAWQRTPAIDAAVAFALFIVALLERQQLMNSADAPVHVIAAGLMTLPLAARRRFPATAVWLSALGLLGETLLASPAPSVSSFAAGLLAAYSLAVHAQARQAAAAGAALAVAIIVFLVVDPETSSLLTALPTPVLLAVTAGIGIAVRRRDREAGRTAEEAAARERTRIARELHDLVGHTVGLMVIQAGSGRIALEHADYETAGLAMARVEAAGREALTELRMLLDILRVDVAEEAEQLTPQPGLEAIRGLVDQLAAQGRDVELQVEGDCFDVPPSVALSAYRIVQESLTNVVKHAGATTARVSLRYGRGELHVEIVDDGAGMDAAPQGHRGYGLVGMRERATLHGGAIQAGPRPGGGFSVSASLPVGSQ